MMEMPGQPRWRSPRATSPGREHMWCSGPARLAVRCVSHHVGAPFTPGVDGRGADVTDRTAAVAAAEGAAVVYRCLNAAYTNWPELFPPLQRNVLAAAESSGALLVSLETSTGTVRPVGRP
jgi:uncharacterized protein YbjT (DUF2867 family)